MSICEPGNTVLTLKVVKRASDVNWLAFTRDSTALFVRAMDNLSVTSTVSLWETGTGRERDWPPPGFDLGARPSEHPSGRWLFVPAAKGGLAAHDPTTGETRIEPFKERADRVAVTAGGHIVLFCRYTWPPPCRYSYGSLTWSDAGFGPGFDIDVFPDSVNGGYCRGLAPLPDGARFVTLDDRASAGTRLAVRAVADGSVLAATDVNDGDNVLAVAPDGERAVVAGGRRLTVFDLNDLGRAPTRLSNDGNRHFTGAAFHSSGKYLAATGNDETVKLYDTTTWELARTFTWNIGRMRSVAFSPDGALAAAGSDKSRVVVWDVDL